MRAGSAFAGIAPDKAGVEPEFDGLPETKTTRESLVSYLRPPDTTPHGPHRFVDMALLNDSKREANAKARDAVDEWLRDKTSTFARIVPNAARSFESHRRVRR